MSDLVIDAGIANEIAATLTSGDLSGIASVPYPAMDVPGATVGASLGNNLVGVFNSFNDLLTAKANNVRQAAQIMIQVDADIAQGTGQ